MRNLLQTLLAQPILLPLFVPLALAQTLPLASRDDAALRHCLQGSDCVSSFALIQNCYDAKIGTTPLSSIPQSLALSYQKCVCNNAATNNDNSWDGCMNCLYGGNMTYTSLENAENAVVGLCNSTASQDSLSYWVASFIIFMDDIQNSFSVASAIPSAATITGDMVSYFPPTPSADNSDTSTPTDSDPWETVSINTPTTLPIPSGPQAPPTAELYTSATSCPPMTSGTRYTSIVFTDGPTTVYVVMPSSPPSTPSPTQRTSTSSPALATTTTTSSFSSTAAATSSSSIGATSGGKRTAAFGWLYTRVRIPMIGWVRRVE